MAMNCDPPSSHSALAPFPPAGSSHPRTMSASGSSAAPIAPSNARATTHVWSCQAEALPLRTVRVAATNLHGCRCVHRTFVTAVHRSPVCGCRVLNLLCSVSHALCLMLRCRGHTHVDREVQVAAMGWGPKRSSMFIVFDVSGPEVLIVPVPFQCTRRAGATVLVRVAYFSNSAMMDCTTARTCICTWGRGGPNLTAPCLGPPKALVRAIPQGGLLVLTTVALFSII